ncbi:MAG: hypothetical protein GWP08_04395 [Nitrospiraceae bacterium]|nr:hypothetical protein [Nitrospiraceae bacterium]
MKTPFARYMAMPTLVCAAVLGLWWGATAYAVPGGGGEALRAYPHKILFESYDEDNWEIFVMNADGSGRRNLTQTKKDHELYPQASPDGSRICFLADAETAGGTVRSVYYMEADGTGRRLVAEKARQPCWSPDGRRIAFVRQEFSKFRVADYVSKGLYMYDLDTGQTQAHPNDNIEHLYNLTWSADGRWIVATVHAGMGYGHANIAIEVDGMAVHNLGIPGCRPCLSADGKRITWSSNDHEIAIADIDFSGPVPKVSNVGTVYKHPELHLYHPDFSPDARYVTFSVGPGGRTAAKGPGTYTEVAEMVGVAGLWNVCLKRADGQGDLIDLTGDQTLSNKESEWLSVSAMGKDTQ